MKKTRAQRRREERLKQKKKKLDLDGWSISEEPIKDEEHLQTEIARWLSVKGSRIIYDDECGGINAVFHPSCETNPKPHFHMIILS